MLNKRAWLSFLVFMAVSLGISLGVNYLSPVGIALVGQWDSGGGTISARSKADVVHPEVEINNPLKVRKIILEGLYFVVDARTEDDYGDGHLPGAHSFPLHKFDENLPRLMELVGPKDPLLIYCSGFTCTDSHAFAQLLRELGYSRVHVYAGGFEEWEEMGFDIER